MIDYLVRFGNSVAIVAYLACLGPIAVLAAGDPEFRAWCDRSLFVRQT